jgi:aryl-alcohol dehydrogenase-like predicted oxidoreductase
MRYRPLGQSGLLVSVVGLGGNNFGSRLDVDGTRAVVDAVIFSGWQLADAAHLAARDGRTPFISAQNHWSLLERQAEAEVVPAARRFGLGVLPYFPLANGLLTGKVRRGQPIPAGTRLAGRQSYVTEEKLARVEALAAWAQERGVTLLETAIGALAAHPGCSSVIAGATSAEQVKANAAAADWTPTEAELAEIDAIVPPPPSPVQ